MVSDEPAPQSSVLYAASKLISLRCAQESTDYMTCKQNDRNPQACLGAGEAVLKCTSKLLQAVKAKCGGEFNKYSACLDYYSNNFAKCRLEQKSFEEAADKQSL